MAGYKQKILEYNPVLFLTFDGDRYDSFTRLSTASPPSIMDESEYGNNALLRNEFDEFPNYRMGLPSIVELEPTDQRSISFGWYGQHPTAPHRWTKAYLEVTHQDQLALDENDGSFTLSFVFNKESNEQVWRDVEYNAIPQGAWNSTLIRPFIRKAGVFYIWYQDNWTIEDQFHIQHPGGQMTLTMTNDVIQWFYKNDHVLTFVWDVKEVEEDEFVGTATLYINGRVIIRQTFNYFDEPPSSTSSAPIEIAGTINPGGATDADRQTSRLMLDQMYLLNQALTEDEVMALYKKTRTYDRIVLMSRPSYYFPMADSESTVNNTMQNLVPGAANGTYLGGVSQVLRRQAGPPRMNGASSVQFLNGGAAVVHTYRVQNDPHYATAFNPTGNFTVEFWARFDNSHRSVLFALQSDNAPYNGILVQANMRNNTNIPGHIQFNVTQSEYLNSRQTRDNGQPYNFSDGQFHHICVVRRGAQIELWIDGVLHAAKDSPIAPVPNPGPGQIYLMGAAPGNLSTNGNMSSVAVYPLSLDPQEIRLRNIYALRYRIRGTITLQGNPHQATVRAINHRTGNLVKEVLSDQNTGDYSIELYDTALIDLMALNKQDRNIRYRVYGPITPLAFDDLPI